MEFSYFEAHPKYDCSVTGQISVKTGCWDDFGFLMDTCNFSSAGNKMLECNILRLDRKIFWVMGGSASYSI